MRFSVRELVSIAIFAALWGAVEIGLGSLLHTLKIPFSGLLLGTIGVTIALIGRLFVSRPGSVLFIGLVTALLKALSVGGVVLNPMIGIVAEALLAEIVVTALGQPRRASLVLAGALAGFWSLLHPFFTQGILAGSGIVTVYGWTVENGARLLGFDPSAIAWIVAVLAGIHLLAGGLGGLLAWDAGRAVRARLRPPLENRDVSV